MFLARVGYVRPEAPPEGCVSMKIFDRRQNRLHKMGMVLVLDRHSAAANGLGNG
jgi:hypothetical protein